MAEQIDELSIGLRLDTSGMQQGAQDALKSLEQLVDGANDAGVSIDELIDNADAFQATFGSVSDTMRQGILEDLKNYKKRIKEAARDSAQAAREQAQAQEQAAREQAQIESRAAAEREARAKKANADSEALAERAHADAEARATRREQQSQERRDRSPDTGTTTTTQGSQDTAKSFEQLVNGANEAGVSIDELITNADAFHATFGAVSDDMRTGILEDLKDYKKRVKDAASEAAQAAKEQQAQEKKAKAESDRNARDVEAAKKKEREASEKSRKAVELDAKKTKDAGKDSTSFLVGLTKAAQGLATTLGLTKVAGFLGGLLSEQSDLAYLSKRLNMSVNDIQKWRYVAEQFGGTKEGLDNQLSNMSQAIEQYNLGFKDSPIIKMAMSLGIESITTVDKLLDDIREKVKTMPAPKAIALMNIGGITDIGTQNSMLSSDAEYNDVKARAASLPSVSKDDAEKSKLNVRALNALKIAWERLANEGLAAARPMIEKTTNAMGQFSAWVINNKDIVIAFLTGLGTVIAVALIPALASLAVAAGALLLTPLGALVAFGAAIAGLKSDYDSWKSGTGSFIDWANWQSEVALANDAMDTLKTALSTGYEAFIEFKNKTDSPLNIDNWQGTINIARNLLDDLGAAFKSAAGEGGVFGSIVDTVANALKTLESFLGQGSKITDFFTAIGAYVGYEPARKQYPNAPTLYDTSDRGRAKAEPSQQSGASEQSKAPMQGGSASDRAAEKNWQKYKVGEMIEKYAEGDKNLEKVMTKIGYIESGFDPNVGSGSGAHGIGQFTGGTWKETWPAIQKKYGFSGTAASNRNNPEAQVAALAELTRKNIRESASISGGDQAADIYALHNVGSGSGAKLLRANRNNPNADLRETISSTKKNGQKSYVGYDLNKGVYGKEHTAAGGYRGIQRFMSKADNFVGSKYPYKAPVLGDATPPTTPPALQPMNIPAQAQAANAINATNNNTSNATSTSNASSNSTDIKIDNISINAPNAKTGGDVGGAIMKGIKNNNLVNNANTGMS